MKYSEINHSGYINTKSGNHIAYDLIDGYITIHTNENISELDNNKIITSTFDKGQFLFCTSLPIINNCLFIRNYKYPIKYVIKNYQPGTKYTKAKFSFAELQCLFL